jgi:DNA adenine methylase
MKPRPFVKWVGGKTQLLPELRKRIPPTWNPEKDLYVEPFVGGGALFWDLQPTHAVLSDVNKSLVRAWQAFRRNETGELIELLRLHEKAYRRDPEKTYYHVRDCFGGADSLVDAARLIFLNKTGFNGLYRENKSGGFNVPWGRNPNVTIVDLENLRACGDLLHERNLTIHINEYDFEPGLSFHVEGSLIYFDPPYVPISKTSNFTTYNAGGFKYPDQLRLVIYATTLRDCGAHVILSQAADECLIDQYRRCGFTCDLVQARRAVNSVGTKRGLIGEYIIHEGL